jgi:cytochrome-b5 reductase
MFRSRRLLCARLLSTSTPPPASPSSPFRFRFSSLIFFTSTGVLVSSYFFWPSKYRGSPTYSNKPLSPSYFVPVTVSDSSQAGPDLAVLTLSIPPGSHSSDEKNPSSFDPIWSIFIKDDDIQVERPYTPLYGIDEKGAIKLWVKKYSGGEVGRWLHSKKAGDTIEIRGPVKTFPFQDGEWDEVVMVYLCLPPSRPFTTFSDSSLTDFWGNRLFAVPPVIVSTASQRPPPLSQYPLHAPSRISEFR